MFRVGDLVLVKFSTGRVELRVVLNVTQFSDGIEYVDVFNLTGPSWGEFQREVRASMYDLVTSFEVADG